MTEHLSAQELAQHRARTLAPEALLRVDGHLSACDACQQRFTELAAVPETSMRLSLSQASAEDEAIPHLDYELIAAYVDGTLDEVELEIADSHLLFCAGCADEIKELRAFSRQISQQSAKTAVVESRPNMTTRWRVWLSAFSPARTAMVAAAILLAVTAIWIIRRTALPETPTQVAQAPTVNSATPPSINSNQVPIGGQRAESNSNQSANEEVASVNTNNNQQGQANRNNASPPVRTNPQPPVTIALNDGAQQVTLDSQGNLGGLETLPPATQRAVREALTNKGLSRPALLDDLSGQNITLLDNTAEGVPFALVGPTGVVVQSTQPTLRWQPLKGATAYVVAIFDDNFKQIARSEQLSSTAWTPRSLARGRIYTWQVTALKDGQEIVSPVPPAPEARFKVLEAKQAAEIEQARKLAKGSHLTLGVVYARAGLVDEARREFQALVKENPSSTTAHKLLESVQSWPRK